MGWRENLDFPISYSFYRSLCLQHGEGDPGPCYLPVKEIPDIIPDERYFEGKPTAKTRGVVRFLPLPKQNKRPPAGMTPL